MKRPELQIVYRNGRVVALLPREPEPVVLRPLVRELDFKVKNLCDFFQVSDRQLHRVFNDSLGISPKDWMRRERMVVARQLLLEGLQIKEAAAELGFPATKDFGREFQAFYEVSPTDFQRRHDAERDRRLE